uniref:ATP synthase subunit 8 n=1 Tax=Laqueus rubellus TaxID=93892 RepID=Q9MQZ3_LAQRU|nr:ATP synthase F0 subunit 8 [Laqueus rubellus]BAA95924.1 ATP synthase subunit 8 [Laqueus rubellus]
MPQLSPMGWSGLYVFSILFVLVWSSLVWWDGMYGCSSDEKLESKKSSVWKW